MRVQHNIMAMNSYRNYSNNVSALSGNLEKLSSGYKINRAGDDAAGLAISEKMRAQITGLDAAQKNVKDGISLVKTAEGAMQEIQDMLNRMDYLATQSANGTYQNEVDRENLQKEVDALKTEINRIADSANFNGIKLLDGSLGEGTSSTSVEGMTDITMTTKTDAQLAGKDAQKGKWELDLNQYTFTSADKTSQFNISVGGTVVATVSIKGTASSTIKEADVSVTSKEIALGTGVTATVRFDNGKLTVEMVNTPTTTAQGAKMGVPTTAGLKVTFTEAQNKITVNTMGSAGDEQKIASATDLQLTTVNEARGPGDKRIYATGTFSLTSKHLKDGMTLKIGNESYTLAIGQDSKFKGGKNVIDLTDMTEKEATTDAKKKFAVGQRISEAFKNNSQFEVEYDKTSGAGLTFTLTEKEGSGLDYIGSAIVGKKSGGGVAANNKDADWKGIVQFGQASTDTSGGGGLMLQIGDTADSFNQMRVKVGDMHVAALGIDGIDIGNQEGAAAAISKIKDAINSVSSVRGDLGAIQNRLDHTANNLSVMEENIQDAESTIRDTDVAEEMMSYVKNNILVQSAQAMLAQANQVPQGVLQLLG